MEKRSTVPSLASTKNHAAFTFISPILLTSGRFSPIFTAQMTRKPRYAVIALTENADVGSFFNLLISNGYSNVTFVTNLAEHSEVKKLLSNVSTSNSTAECAPSSLPDIAVSSSSTPEIVVGASSPTNARSSPALIPSTSIIMNKTIPLVFDPQARSVYKPNAEVINCQLCDNKIMCSRLSNLTNHVRRHSSVKQYSCIYCPYQHNEMSKVRTHMAGQHGDTLTSPNDNLTPELQKIWCAYMEKCFPGYLESQGKTGRNAVEVFGGRTLARMENNGNGSGIPLVHLDEEVVPLGNNLHNCLECGDAVCGDPNLSNEPFADHIQQKHADGCQPFKCGECGYLNAQEYEVRAHVSAEHAMIASVVPVTEEPLSTEYQMFLSKFFPSLEGGGIIDDAPADMSEVADCSQLSAEDILNGNAAQSELNEEMNAEGLLGASSEDGDEVQACCTVCSCSFGLDDLDGMMQHAKDHYCIKQFECPHCPFGTNELQDAQNHLNATHKGEGQVIDHTSSLMQQAWMQTMKKCFPDVAGQLLQQEKVEQPSIITRPRKRARV